MRSIRRNQLRGIRRRYATYSASPGRLRYRIQVEQRCRRGCKNIFGAAYDISTILILWFAGASAMAGLLNIVPRYLPRYGMAPDWSRANRPLVIVFTIIAFAVTIIFKADVDAQGGAYATGALVLMSSAAVAVTLSAWRKGAIRYAYLLIAIVFVYTTVVNIIERPEGMKVAAFFIISIIVVSFASRAWRATELRVDDIDLQDAALAFIEGAKGGTIRIIANRPDKGDVDEYRLKEKQERWNNHIPPNDLQSSGSAIACFSRSLPVGFASSRRPINIAAH